MADFCEQCSKEMGFESSDLKNLVGPSSPYPAARNAFFMHTLCEGCGDAVVDVDGVCHSVDCLYVHGDIGTEREAAIPEEHARLELVVNDNAKS